jgi:putative mRNA 3-end processing factor
MRTDLVTLRPEGLYCPPGDFHIDPWRPVERAVLTHAHGDHARPGHARYLAVNDGEAVLRKRLGDVAMELVAYAQPRDINGVKVSFHPAGHVLGSAQVRIEYGGDVWVVSGDYKLQTDPTCIPFEPVRCHVFITESTFGLPIYHWLPPRQVFDEIDAWWRTNADEGRASVLFGYAFGKAQRLLASVDTSIGPLVCHGAVDILNDAYRLAGVKLPPTARAGAVPASAYRRALVVAPPSAQSTPWLKRFGEYSDGFASGWMQLRGARRRRGVDRGFVLSDHADWPGLLEAIAATGAERVIATHGYANVLARWLQRHGLQASTFETEYGDEETGTPADPDTVAGVRSETTVAMEGPE